MESDKRLHIETLAIHGANSTKEQAAVRNPIHVTTTFERNTDGSYPTDFVYSREDNPNRVALEQLLTQLEGGATGLAFASGSAAALAVVHSLQSGSHIVAPQDMYYGTKQIFTDLYGRWGLTCSFVDMGNLASVETAITDQTELIWVETPSNPMLGISDLRGLCELGKRRSLSVLADNTWATPISMQPISLGADVVLHSTTKYIGGHSDIIGGALVFNANNEMAQRARMFQKKGGAVPSPFDCWLLVRSAATLPVRFNKQSQNALLVAEFLSTQSAIETVLFPGLPSHPNYRYAKDQMNGFGAMLSVLVRGDQPQAMKLAANLQLFTRATSLGGVESLVEHRASVEGPATTTPTNLLRFSIGLEHPDDLIADLKQALEVL